MRALAVTTATRWRALPEVPTLDESGLKGFSLDTWFGVLVPAVTPREIVTRLNVEIIKIINSHEFNKRWTTSVPNR